MEKLAARSGKKKNPENTAVPDSGEIEKLIRESRVSDQNELQKMTEDIVSLYDFGISSVSSLMNRIYETIDVTELENGALKEELKESLAKRITLRKKDFDNLFDDIFSNPSRENKIELKKRIDDLVHEHSNSVVLLRKKISERRKIRLEEFKELFDRIRARQMEREDEVRMMISEFQMQHQNMLFELKEFLLQDKVVRLRDLKKLMNKCRKEREIRKKENEERANKWRRKS